VAAELKRNHSPDVEIIKKSSAGLLLRVSLPKLPAWEIDAAVVFEGRDIIPDGLEAVIERQS